MLADPLCRLDFCLETDGAVAVITTSTERARDCLQPPALIHGVAHGGRAEWGRAFAWMGMPDPHFASSGHKPVADRLYAMSGVSPKDIDVALLYDHFSALSKVEIQRLGAAVTSMRDSPDRRSRRPEHRHHPAVADWVPVDLHFHSDRDLVGAAAAPSSRVPRSTS